MLFGMRCPIDDPGESFWSDETQGLKQNELVWSCSHDDGRSWQPPRVVPMPVPSAAEALAPLCLTRDERWLGCYSPIIHLTPNCRSIGAGSSCWPAFIKARHGKILICSVFRNHARGAPRHGSSSCRTDDCLAPAGTCLGSPTKMNIKTLESLAISYTKDLNFVIDGDRLAFRL